MEVSGTPIGQYRRRRQRASSQLVASGRVHILRRETGNGTGGRRRRPGAWYSALLAVLCRSVASCAHVQHSRGADGAGDSVTVVRAQRCGTLGVMRLGKMPILAPLEAAAQLGRSAACRPQHSLWNPPAVLALTLAREPSQLVPWWRGPERRPGHSPESVRTAGQARSRNVDVDTTCTPAAESVLGPLSSGFNSRVSHDLSGSNCRSGLDTST